MGKILAFLYFFMFNGLVAATFWAFYVFIEPVFWFYIVCLLFMFLRFAFKVRDPVTAYARDVMTSVDQHWQVIFAPLLNLGVTTKHKFGNPDETASSVVGKNLRATNGRHWILIERLLSVVLEGGRPHSVPSIEDDETV